MSCCPVCSCLLVLAVSVLPPGPRIDLPRETSGKTRICSPHFAAYQVISNVGTEPLIIHSVRPDCSGCWDVHLQSRSIAPGESSELVVRGKRAREGEFGVAVFLETNDSIEPIKKVQMEFDYSRDYAVDIWWRGSDQRICYPYESALGLEAISLGRAATLGLRLHSLRGYVVKRVAVDAEYFELESFTRTSLGAEVRLQNKLRTPGIYHDCLHLKINDNALMTIPVQIVMYNNFGVVDPCVSFSYAWEGAVVIREVELVFDDPEAMWKTFDLQVPKDVDRAFCLTNCEIDGDKVKLRVRIDTKFLGGKGLKTVAACVVGGSDAQKAHVSFYGWVY